MSAAGALLLTLGVFALAQRLARRAPSPWTHPVGVSVLVLVLVVRVSPLELAAYERGTAPLVWLLRPAVVALGWSVYRERERLAQWAAPLLRGVVAGTIVSLVATPLLAAALGAEERLQRALALKSVTSAVAVDLAPRLGVEAALAVPLIILTGILGAAFGRPLLRALGIRSALPTGVALGTTSHGIGTAALARHDLGATAAAALAMGTAALVTALLAPPVWWLLGWALPAG